MVTFLTAYLRLENHHLIFLPCSGIFKHFLSDCVTGTEYSGHSWEMRFKPHWLTVPPQPNQESGFWDSHPHIIINPCLVLLRCTRARAPWFLKSVADCFSSSQWLSCSTVNRTYYVVSKCLLPMCFISLLHLPDIMYLVTSSGPGRGICFVLVCQRQNAWGHQGPSSWLDFSCSPGFGLCVPNFWPWILPFLIYKVSIEQLLHFVLSL